MVNSLRLLVTQGIGCQQRFQFRRCLREYSRRGQRQVNAKNNKILFIQSSP